METSHQDLVKQLVSLVHLDIDAVHAYRQAIQQIHIQDVKENLTQFQHDHETHVSQLGICIRNLGGQPPEFKPDFKGFIIQGFTALRSSLGIEGALRAMRGNEQLTNTTYDKALTWDLPDDVRAIVKKNREDERRHLAYIELVLSQRVWEKAA